MTLTTRSIANTNDGSAREPELRCFLNAETLLDLPSRSIWPQLKGIEAVNHLREVGFEGIQMGQVIWGDGWIDLCRNTGLATAGAGAVRMPSEAESLIAQQQAAGHIATTLHVGWGLEDDTEIDRLVDAVMTASARYAHPVYIELHRSTITQDMWRTVQLTRRFPGIRFNGDFSHYYTGQEMPYGGLARKLDFLLPIFERTRFLHGRIGDACCMQVDVGDGLSGTDRAYGATDFIDDFRQIWTQAMYGFLHIAQPGDYLIFAPEILPGDYYYARKFRNQTGLLQEESDRFAQALIYNQLARSCFQAAQSEVTAQRINA